MLNKINTGVKSMFNSILFVLFVILGSSQAWAADDYVIYYHNDALGSPVAATDSAGQVLWKEHYHPYGEKAINDQKAFNEKLGYTGKSFDRSTGLSYYGARYYDPVIGRFMGIDPVGFQEGNVHSFNSYAYANNNPLAFVDPNGLYPVSVGDIPGNFVDLPGPPRPPRARRNALQQFWHDSGDKLIGSIDAFPGVGSVKAGTLGIIALAGVKFTKNISLPIVRKAVNSNLPHAAGRGVSRGIFSNSDQAVASLKSLTSQIKARGFPKGSIIDTAYADRVLVPVGNRGLASYQVGKNGTAKLKTVLNAK